MEQQVYRYTVDLKNSFDGFVSSMALSIGFHPDAVRLAEGYTREMILRTKVVEVEAVVCLPGQYPDTREPKFAPATLGELLAFAKAFPDASWGETLIAQGTDFYYGHADGCPALERTENGWNLKIFWAYRFYLRSRLFVRTI